MQNKPLLTLSVRSTIDKHGFADKLAKPPVFGRPVYNRHPCKRESCSKTTLLTGNRIPEKHKASARDEFLKDEILKAGGER
ncbi:hypothetical protein RvVAR0630_08680 [Agrobacterium vitis]|nr:hypothetical protein RvVAR0630_08680 [Agrobacterium vitis]